MSNSLLLMAMEVEMEIKVEATAETLAPAAAPEVVATADGIAAVAGSFASHATSTLPPVGATVECQFNDTWERGVVSRVDTAGTSQRFSVEYPPEGNPGAVWEEWEEPVLCSGPPQSQSQWRLVGPPMADTSSDSEGVVDKVSGGGGVSAVDHSTRISQATLPPPRSASYHCAATTMRRPSRMRSRTASQRATVLSAVSRSTSPSS